MKYVTDYQKYWNYYGFLRDKMSAASMKTATFITAEAVEFLRDKPEQETESNVAQIMQEITESIDAGKLFKTKADAFMAYNLLKQIQNFEWEDLLGSIDGKSCELVHVPAVLVEQFAEKIDPDTKTILIAEGEKFTPNLKELVDRFPACEYTITTMAPGYELILKRIFDGYKNVSIVLTSIYEYEFVHERFDLILCMPVFGSRLLVDREQHFICREHEMVATENLLLHLNRGGRLAILLPARITFAGGSVKELRDFIQEMYKVESISQMPEGLLDWTNIRTYVLTIGTGHTDDVSLQKYVPDEYVTGSGNRIIRSLRVEDETFVMLTELVEQGDWNLERFFAEQDEDWQRFLGVRREMLGEVAVVFRGKNVARKNSTGSIGVVNISNLREYDIDYDNLDHIEETERKVANYILEPGDILIPARGTTVKTAIFEKQDYPCIASSNLVVIRPRKDMLDSTYLKMFFDSPLGGKLLTSAQQGPTVMNLSYKDMQNIEIPVPELGKQKKLAEEYNSELKLYLETVHKAETRWNSVLRELQAKL